jgi:hypothetical protein
MSMLISKELEQINIKFSQSGWNVLEGPSKAWLNGNRQDKEVYEQLIEAINKAISECG